MEGAIAGSEFMPNSVMPGCQIKLYRNNMFTATFIGFGVRVTPTVMALPTHVYRLANFSLLMESYVAPGKRVLVNSHPVQSLLASDVSYIQLSPELFSQIGVSVMQSAKDIDAHVVVSVAGPKGTSSGVLIKHSTPGMVKYNGSTDAGYSGAPYFVGERIFGMHSGMAGDINVGISVSLLLIEVRKLFKGEGSVTLSSPSVDGKFEENFLNKTRAKIWNKRDLENYFDARVENDDSWAMGADVDYEEKLVFEGVDSLIDGLASLSPADLNLALAKIEKLKAQQVLHGQGQGLVEALLDHPGSSVQLNQAKLIKKLSSRVEELEKKVESLEDFATRTHTRIDDYRKKLVDFDLILNKKFSNPKEIVVPVEKKKIPLPVNPFPCSKCARSFKTTIGLEAHMERMHFQGESALTRDDSDTMKKTGRVAFLGKNSHPKMRRSYRPNSSSVDKSDQYQSIMKSLDTMADLIRNMISVSGNLPPATAGPSLAGPRN